MKVGKMSCLSSCPSHEIKTPRVCWTVFCMLTSLNFDLTKTETFLFYSIRKMLTLQMGWERKVVWRLCKNITAVLNSDSDAHWIFFSSRCILKQKVLMYFSLPSSKVCHRWAQNFAFTPSPASSPCLCVLTVCSHRWQLQTWSTGDRAGCCGDSPPALRCHVSVSCGYIEAIADVWIRPLSIFLAIFPIDLWRK